MYHLLTDSAIDLPYQTLIDNHVDFVSMHVDINGQEYTDDLEHHFDLNHFYQQIANGVMPSTAQINIGQFVEFFLNRTLRLKHQFYTSDFLLV